MTGRPRRRPIKPPTQFSKGYQEALFDVLTVFEMDGPEAARLYIQNNIRR